MFVRVIEESDRNTNNEKANTQQQIQNKFLRNRDNLPIELTFSIAD